MASTAGPYGSTSGTLEGPDGPSGQTTIPTKLHVWSDGSFIYAIKFRWSPTEASIYGNNSNGTETTLTLNPEHVTRIDVHVDDTSGYFNGMVIYVDGSSTFSGGDLGGGGTTTTAFNGSSNSLTDIQTRKGNPGSGTIIWGIKFYYITSAPFARKELALPALGALAHTYVVTRSYCKVGCLRKELNVVAPSCDPPLGTDPAKAQLWYRTFRAQENCKEMLLVYLPSILIASTLGYEAFGKWAPRAVGVLTMVGAVCRYKYLTAYIEDADKRGPPFRYAAWSMKPVFALAVLSCGYLIGRDIYQRLFIKRPVNEDLDV